MEFYIEKYSQRTFENIDVSFLPPMARRKLSLLDKIALCLMNDCISSYKDSESIKNLKIVFASRYGELDRLKKLVYQYTEENEVSPATFSGSVHNSVVGQFSLLNKITAGYNSISAEENTFEAGLIEAVISSKDNDVLFCCCDAMSETNTKGFSCLIKHGKNPNIKYKNRRLYKQDGEKICVNVDW